ncbi:MAG: sigma-54-dependent Fis family transcriptional regulator [Planctomycetes bacterium]|nr:sigma-54-dependent Fis family transcriptional regulator [Planctomycetota bacterium]
MTADEALRALAQAVERSRPGGPGSAPADDDAARAVLELALVAGHARGAFLARVEETGLRCVRTLGEGGAALEVAARQLERVADRVRESLDGVVDAPPPSMTGGRAPRGAVAVKAEAGHPPVHALPVVDPETGAWEGVLGLLPSPTAPVDPGEAQDHVFTVLGALLGPHLLRGRERPAGAVEAKYDYAEFVTRSPKVQAVLKKLDRVIGTDVSVLITGETGTGKELVARALHRNDAKRKKKRFYAQNCGAITESLLESLLFGHEKGAFTGADRRKQGLFEIASGSTLFLDEIGEMSLDMQTKLLRVLQEREVVPLGASEPVKVDVRIVAATLRDLDADVAAGRFRQDLYHRLKVVRIDLPPLRERPEDVPLLVDHFLKKVARERGARPKVLDRRDERILQVLTRYPWPGNIRQLENVVTKLAYLAGDVITYEALAEDKQLLGEPEAEQAPTRPPRSLDAVVEEVERAEIENALKLTRGNRSRAAALLQINRRSLLRRLQKYGYAADDEEDDGQDGA